MIHFDSLGALAQHLIESTAAGIEAAHEGMDKAAALLQRAAKAEFGVYQQGAGPFPAWEDLADSTMADRRQHGYPENEPLLRDGTLRDSIEREVHNLDGINTEGIVGSTSEIMPFHEFGTSKMPPRPVLGLALERYADVIAAMIANPLVGALTTTARVGYDEDENYVAREFEDGAPVHWSFGYDQQWVPKG